MSMFESWRPAIKICSKLTEGEEGSLRRDVYFRLNEFAIRVPPLRERREDILYLAKRFVDLTNIELQKEVRSFTEPAVDLLLAYHWPGNVRQLRSTIRRAVLLADNIITEQHLAIEVARPGMQPSWKAPRRSGFHRSATVP